MPQQLILATPSHAARDAVRKTARCEVFLAEMHNVAPCAELRTVIEPFYPRPRADGGGHPVVGTGRALCIHHLQQRYALTDPAVEEVFSESVPVVGEGIPKPCVCQLTCGGDSELASAYERGIRKTLSRGTIESVGSTDVAYDVPRLL